MQRFVRSIVPGITRDGFNVPEAGEGASYVQDNQKSSTLQPDNTKENTVVNKTSNNESDTSGVTAQNGTSFVRSVSDSDVTTRRRRGSRRVVRVAGAAGEAMKLHVQDTSAPYAARPITSLLFQEPVLPNRSYNTENSNDTDSFDERSNSEKNRRASSKTEYKGRRASRGNSDTDELDDLSESASSRNSRNSRDLRNSRNNDADRDDADSRNNDDIRNSSDSRSSSADQSRRDGRNNRKNRDSRNTKDYRDSEDTRAVSRRQKRTLDETSSRSRSSRRLNASERRAAAEVEKIEEDLVYDDIVYAPITRGVEETLDISDLFDSERTGRSERDSRKRDGRDGRDRDGRDGRDRDGRDSSDGRDSRDSDDSSSIRDNDKNYDNDSEDGMIIRRRRRRGSRAKEESANADNGNYSDNASNDASNDARDNAIDNAIENLSKDSEDSDNFTYSGSRRRRSRTTLKQDNGEISQDDSDIIPDPDELRASAEEEETLYTRRRRRRRSKSSDDAANSTISDASSEDSSPRRSRKQQYIDEITDIEGSTRLEAKRQRRRDNRRERSRQNMIMEQDFLARRENVERLMVVRERDRHTQISVIEDNILVEHYVSDIQEVATVGNIYLGRIQNVLPSMEAAFVDIGQARNGVLYAGEVNWDMTRLEGQPRRIELAFKSGDPVLVQVTKDPIGHKGARLTSQVTIAGRFLVLVPSGGMTGVSRKLSDRERSRLRGIVSKIAPKDMGVIIRTAAEGATEEAIQKDLESLMRQWERIEEKRQEFLHGKRPKLLQGEPDVAIRVVRDIFNDDFQKLIVEGEGVCQRIKEYLEMMAPDLLSKIEYWDPAEHEGKDIFDKWQIDSQLRKGMERQVYLQSGGSIVIDRTEAMTTIDVNTGRFIGRGKSLEETVTRCNLEASEEIARQLRLRDIGGMVMIDYVDMVMPANRDLVLRRLLECLARDRTKHQVAEVTSLGLVQMTRKRVGQGLVEAFSEECPTCKGRGFILHDEPTVSSEYADPYALKGGDPFIKTNKHGHGSLVESATVKQQGSSADVRAKFAQIAAATTTVDSSDKNNDDSSSSEFTDNSDADNSGSNNSGSAVNVSAEDSAALHAVESLDSVTDNGDSSAHAEVSAESVAKLEVDIVNAAKESVKSDISENQKDNGKVSEPAEITTEFPVIQPK